MSEPVFIQAITTVMGTVAFLGLLSFLRRLIELRHARRVPIAMDGIQERLERIESVVEATAVEVERISEGNRFMAKLLEDRAHSIRP
jgi:hypothetical protein